MPKFFFNALKFYWFTSLDIEWTNIHPDFQNSCKKLFHIDSEGFRSRDSKSQEPRCLGYFCKILYTDFFFKITSFFSSLCKKFKFFIISNTILHVFAIIIYNPLWCSGYESRLWRGGFAFVSRLTHYFLLNIYSLTGWTFVHPMSRPCRLRSCPDWLTI